MVLTAEVIMTNTNNPIGLDGVNFVEYSSPENGTLEKLFTKMGFKEAARLPNANVKLFVQGQVRFFLNNEKNSFSSHFASQHGPCISATGFRVQDSQFAFKTAVARGAKPYTGGIKEKVFHDCPAVYGIGDSLVFFVDQELSEKLYTQSFSLNSFDQNYPGVGLTEVDHFTNNVPKGEMQKWCDFYEQVFNFRETRYFDIRGKQTGLVSKVMRSPCGKFSIPINEPTEGKSQIQEYLDEYKGSGIQHLALTTNNILATMEKMKSSEIQFLTPPPPTYYAMLRDRLPNVVEDIQRLEKNAILADGDQDGYLLQIFTKNLIGPIFYELIQRNNHSGFGEGNFQALFDAIERDQQERGYI